MQRRVILSQDLEDVVMWSFIRRYVQKGKKDAKVNVLPRPRHIVGKMAVLFPSRQLFLSRDALGPV